MSARLRITFSGFGLIVLLAGCQDPVDPPDTLTEAEALALFKALEDAIGFGPYSDSDPGPVDTMWPCTRGGWARVVGTSSGDEIGDTVRLVVSVVVTPLSCTVSGDRLTFTVDGDPTFRIQVTQDIIGFANRTMGGRVEGKIKWQLGDRWGRCAIDTRVDATIDFSDLENPRPSGGFQGKMCDQDIKLDLSLTG